MLSTIDQVAKKTGVSKATVSRVMNNSKPVYAHTRLRVIQAIEASSFMPNPASRSLAIKESRITGVVSDDIANLFVSVLDKSIEEIGRTKGYNIFFCNSHSLPEKETELLLMLEDKQVDGIIFFTPQLRYDHSSFFKATTSPIPIIKISGRGKSIIRTLIDKFKAVY